MKIKVVHLWIPAVISYVLALVMGFIEEIIGALIFSILYFSLLVATKWVN